jgi:hypothetical protein
MRIPLRAVFPYATQELSLPHVCIDSLIQELIAHFLWQSEAQIAHACLGQLSIKVKAAKLFFDPEPRSGG